MMGGRPQNNTMRYILLALVFFPALVFQTKTTIELVRNWRTPPLAYRPPFSMRPGTRVIAQVEPVGQQAGLRPGDEVLRVDGEPLRGYSLFRRMDGPEAQFTIRRAGEGEVTIQAPLEMEPRRFTGLQEKMLAALLSVATPWLSLLLGAWAVAVRPRDSQAWLLLALMASFPHLIDAEVYSWSPDAMRKFGIVYHQLMATLMPVSMVLFAIYFAGRFPLDVRAPWAKWLLIGPTAVSGVALTLLIFFAMEALDAGAALRPPLLAAASLYSKMVFVSIGVFFMLMGWKFGITTNPDARRRLKLLMWGSMAAMTPMFVIILFGLALGTNPVRVVPPWILTAALMAMFLFPLTITYVIVVQRALDVRVVLRQGIQYALARGGARVLFVIVGAGVLAASINLALDPDRSNPQKYMLIATGVVALFLLQRLRLKIAEQIDRRFFRQAYDAERILSELSDEVRTVVDEGSLLRRVGESISKALYIPRLAFMVADNGAYRPAFALGYEGAPQVEFDESAKTVQQMKQSQAPAAVYFDDETSWIYRTPAMTGQERSKLVELESQLLLPLAVKERLIGFLVLGQKKSEEPYSGSDLRLLRSLTVQTGLALENSRLVAAIAQEAAQRERVNREIEIAREVQQRLFPQKTPQVDGLDCAGGCRPALSVGGDYYDFLELADGRLGIVIGDVSGKGIGAALLMASLQASVRGQALDGGKTLAAVIGHVNTLIYESSASSRYATLFYAQIDVRTRKLEYVNAGHNPPLVLRGTGEVQRLETGGTVVGLLPRFPYQQGAVELAAGDTLLLFTDGISEAFNAADEEYGEERLIAAMGKAGERSAAELIPYLIDEVDAFVAGAPQHDDMTLVIARIR